MRAEEVYRRVLDLAAKDAEIALPAARSLERIYVARHLHPELAKALEKQVELEESGDAKRAILARLGEICETSSTTPNDAIGAWKRRLEDDPADEKSLASLDRLYERTSEWSALVEVLRARERGRGTTARPPKALRGPHARTRVARSCSARRTRWPIGSATCPRRSPRTARWSMTSARRRRRSRRSRRSTRAPSNGPISPTRIESHLALAEGSDEKLALLARLGETKRARIGDVAGALEAYSRALAIDGAHAPSRAAVEELLGEASVRRDAAALLRPLYEKESAHAHVLRTLEIEAEYAEHDAKLAVLAQAVSIAEGPLHDAKRAWTYASRGLREAAPTSAYGEWLAHAERLTEATLDHAALVELLRAAIPDVADGDAQLETTLMVASLARTRLADATLAREYYVKALEARPDEKRALEALEAIYEEAKDAPALLDVLKRRADAAATDDERKPILFKQARLSDETMGDPRAAIETYESILAIGLDPQAIAALERLYASQKRWDDLVALHEREIGSIGVAAASSARKADLHFALGRIQQTELGNDDDAYAQYEAALRVDPQHGKTVETLEALMKDRAHAARAAEMLEGVYLARLDWRRVMGTLQARLDVSEDPDERRTLLRRLAKLHEEQGEDYRAALETTALLLAEDVADEATWASSNGSRASRTPRLASPRSSRRSSTR